MSEDDLQEFYQLLKNRNQKQKDNQDELGNLLEKYKINTGIPDLAYQHHHYIHDTQKIELE